MGGGGHFWLQNFEIQFFVVFRKIIIFWGMKKLWIIFLVITLLTDFFFGGGGGVFLYILPTAERTHGGNNPPNRPNPLTQKFGRNDLDSAELFRS